MTADVGTAPDLLGHLALRRGSPPGVGVKRMLSPGETDVT